MIQELNIHSEKPLQHSIVDNRWIDVSPENNIGLANTLSFEINNNGNYWLDLAQHQLELTVSVVNADGSALPDDMEAFEVAPSTAFMHTLFNKVSLQLNGTRIGSENDLYGYMAVTKLSLNYDEYAKRFHLQEMIGFDTDMGDITNPASVTNIGNLGLALRKKYIKGSQPFAMIGRLQLGFFDQPKLIPSGVKVRLELQKARPEFCLISAEPTPNYKINFLDCHWKVRGVGLSDPAFMENQLRIAPALYSHQKIELSCFTIPKGSMNWHASNLFLDKIPQRVFLLLVSQKSYNGSYNTNPLAATHKNLSYLDFLRYDQSLIGGPVTANFEKNDCIKMYAELLKAARVFGRPQSFGLEFQSWKSGYTVFGADLSVDQSTNTPTTKGNLTLQLRFSKETKENLFAIVLGEFSARVAINYHRQVTDSDY